MNTSLYELNPEPLLTRTPNAMRYLLPTVTLLLTILLASASQAADKFTKDQKRAARDAAGSVNGVCPVMGRLVTPKGGSSLYKGEKIAFCCPGCDKKFKADPTRYMDRLRLNPPKYWYVSKKPAVAEMRKAKAAVQSANGRCPVMGKVVVAKGGFATYKGQKIAFCCPPCEAKFKKDTAKYMGLMRADPLAYAYDRPGPTNAQIRMARKNAGTANGVCPVMGKAVVPTGGSVTWKGEKIGFCCKGCDAKFNANPEKYMARLRSEPVVYGYAPSGR